MTTIKRINQLSALYLAFVASCPACIGEAGEPKETTPELASTRSELVVTSEGELHATGDASFDLGTADGRTCFLTSVGGSLDPLTGSRMAYIAIDPNNHYKLQAYISASAAGPALSISARCVQSATNRTKEFQWNSGDDATILGAATPRRRCFLTGVRADYVKEGAAPHLGGFNKAEDHVKLFVRDGVWRLGGVQSGHAGAWAQCIDIKEDLGSWQWQAGDPGERNDPLAVNTLASNGACFLTGIGGRFENGKDDQDNVAIHYERGISQFFMRTHNGKTGWANCVR